MAVDFKNREYWIDTIRSFACLCVITTHAPIPGGTNGLSFIGFFNYYSMCGASILFFMISGALVLYSPKPAIPFLKKRLSRIVFPMVFWTIISLFITALHGEITWKNMFIKIANIPIAPQEGVYWFIYVIFGIYLLTPIIATWLERVNKKDLEFYLGIWSITLVLPYITPLSNHFKTLIDFSHGYLFYFSGYLWFAIMGYYLRKYVNLKRICNKHILIALLVLAIPIFLYSTPINHDIIHDRMTIHAVITCSVYFIVLKHINYGMRMKKFFYDFAQHSFGIYLVHVLVMRHLLWPILEPFNIHYAIQIPLITLLTAVISYGVVHLFSKLPYSKYIVGL